MGKTRISSVVGAFKSPNRHKHNPDDSKFVIALNHIVYWIKFFFHQNQRFRAASLTYFSFIGLVPFFTFFIWITDVLKTDTSVASVSDLLFPGFRSSLDSIAVLAQNNLDNLFSHWVTWLAIVLILFFVYCMYDNIQGIFNSIWKSKPRNFRERITTVFKSLIVTVIAIFVASWCFRHIQIRAINRIVAFAIIFLCIAAAFYYLPYDKRPKFVPCIQASIVSTLLLFVWSVALPVIDDFVATYQSSGILCFLIIFWLYWAWGIIILGANICRTLDRSGEDYMKEEIFNMSPFFKGYLSMIVTSYVYRKAADKKGVSFEQIRREMFQTEEGATDEISGELIDNRDAYLPMPLLNQIVDHLCDSRKLIARDTSSKRGVLYYPAKSSEEVQSYTTGDFLFDFFIAGGSLPKYQYETLFGTFESSTVEGLADLFAKQDQRLVDLVPDKSILAPDGYRPEDYGRNRRAMFDSFLKEESAAPAEVSSSNIFSKFISFLSKENVDGTEKSR